MRYRVEFGWGDGQALVAHVEAPNQPAAEAMAANLLARVALQHISLVAPPPRGQTTMPIEHVPVAEEEDDHARWRRPRR